MKAPPRPAGEAYGVAVPELDGARVIHASGNLLCGAVENAVRCVGMSQTVTFSGVVEDFFASNFAGFEGCARLRSGAVACWGTPPIGPKPIPIPGVSDAAEVARLDHDVCVTRTNGILSCFSPTRTGYAPSTDPKYLDAQGNPTSGKIVGACIVKGPAKTISCSGVGLPSFGPARAGWVDWLPGYASGWGNPNDQFLIGRDANGILHGVGNNFFGQLGNGERGHGEASSTLAELGPVTSYAVGSAHVCAVASGKVACWGDSTLGQVPTRAAVRPDLCELDATHAEENLRKRREADEREIRACEAEPGALDCRLGQRPVSLDEMKEPKLDGKCVPAKEPVLLRLEPSPQLIPGIDDAVQVVAFPQSSCALRKTGGVVCWGQGFGTKK